MPEVFEAEEATSSTTERSETHAQPVVAQGAPSGTVAMEVEKEPQNVNVVRQTLDLEARQQERKEQLRKVHDSLRKLEMNPESILASPSAAQGLPEENLKHVHRWKQQLQASRQQQQATTASASSEKSEFERNLEQLLQVHYSKAESKTNLDQILSSFILLYPQYAEGK